MYLEIPIKPLSVNLAWQGKRFKTKAYKQYEKDIFRLIPQGQYDMKCKDEIYVVYVFYFSAYALSDNVNPEKLITDILVKRQYLKDDRYVKGTVCFKEPCAKGHEKIDVYIFENKTHFIETQATILQGFD